MSDFQQIDDVDYGAGRYKLYEERKKFTDEQLDRITEINRKQDHRTHPWQKKNAVLSDKHKEIDEWADKTN